MLSLTKKYVLQMLLAALAAYLFFNAYTQRSVASFLWACSFGLICLTSITAIFRNTALTLISLLVTLAIAESALGYLPTLMANKDSSKSGGVKQEFAYFPPTQTYNTPAYWQLGEFGSQPQPGVFTAKKLASTGETIYDTVFTIGEDGFRVTPHYEVKQRHRVNFLGDSFTFGEGVADNQTMAYFTGEMINRQKGHKLWPLQVKNYGIHGWGIHQSLAVLQSKLDHKADVQFVLTAPWHASRAACADFFTMGSPRYILETSGLVTRDGYCRSFGWVERSPKVLRGLITSSKIFNLIQDSLFVVNDQDQQIKLYLGILRTIQAQAKARGEQLIVGFIKADDQWFVGSFNNEKVLTQIRAAGIKVIDMTLAEQSELLELRYYLHEQDKHPTREANLRRSQLLERYLGF